MTFKGHSWSLKTAGFQGRIQDLKLRGREMWFGRSSAEGTRMEAPTGWACSPSKWCILMHSGARLGQL